MSEQDYWDRMNSVRELKHALERIAELEAAIIEARRKISWGATVTATQILNKALASAGKEREETGAFSDEVARQEYCKKFAHRSDMSIVVWMEAWRTLRDLIASKEAKG